MSERDRQRRLHVENRLEELRAKHGSEIETGEMPGWLDTYEEAVSPAPTTRPVPFQKAQRAPPGPVRVDV